MKDNKINLIGKKRGEIALLCKDVFNESYRVKQLYQWIYKKNVDSFDSMTDMSTEARSELNKHFALSKPEVVKMQNDEEVGKYLLKLDDNNFIEAVSMKEEKYYTLCLSVQVGCPCSCRYCATGIREYIRDLTVAEIIGSTLILRKNIEDNRPVNIVFMGMGEPLLNFDTLADSISLLTDMDGIGISERRITVSTAGILGMIKKLKQTFPRIGISLSINTTDENLRSELMPINKTNSLQEIIAEIRNIKWNRRNPLTLEYIIIRNINDNPDEAKRLAGIARAAKAKVNLIPYNPVKGFEGKAPSEKIINLFLSIISSNNIPVTVRRSKGSSLNAACGQLTGMQNKEKDAKERVTA